MLENFEKELIINGIIDFLGENKAMEMLGSLESLIKKFPEGKILQITVKNNDIYLIAISEKDVNIEYLKKPTVLNISDYLREIKNDLENY